MKKLLVIAKFFVLILAIFLLGPLSNFFLCDRLSSPYVPRYIGDLAQLKNKTIIEVYGAGAGSWQSCFSLHTWIACKRSGEEQFTIYEVRKERVAAGLPAVDKWYGNPDRSWSNNAPKRLFHLEGGSVEALISELDQAVVSYPFQDRYSAWPGPNCNTFLAYLGRTVNKLGLELPPNAIGKDFLPFGEFFTTPPSGCGFEFSLFGLLAVTISRVEGIEIDFLGFCFGFQPKDFALLFPGIGKIRFSVNE